MSLENGILGFLSMKAISGYDIKKLFKMSASFFWPADQTQIYRTLKQLVKEEKIELKESIKGSTVDRKVYAITEKGKEEYLKVIGVNGIDDFISRDAFLLQLFFSGALSIVEQLKFIDRQLANINTLKQRLIDNYNENRMKFLDATGLDEQDRRFHSAVYAHRWGLIKCTEYAKLLENIREEIRNVEDE